MKRGFYTIMAAQFFSSLADNALFVAAVELLRTGGAHAGQVVGERGGMNGGKNRSWHFRTLQLVSDCKRRWHERGFASLQGLSAFWHRGPCYKPESFGDIHVEPTAPDCLVLRMP